MHYIPSKNLVNMIYKEESKSLHQPSVALEPERGARLSSHINIAVSDITFQSPNLTFFKFKFINKTVRIAYRYGLPNKWHLAGVGSTQSVNRQLNLRPISLFDQCASR
jgi:hypothetical protein